MLWSLSQMSIARILCIILICSQRLLQIWHQPGTPRPVSLHLVILVAMLIVWQQPLPLLPLCKPREVLPVEVVQEGRANRGGDRGGADSTPSTRPSIGEEMPVRC